MSRINFINYLSFCSSLDLGYILQNVAKSLPHFVFVFLLFFTTASIAFQSETLPKGISYSSVKFGQINGLDQRYQEDGELVQLKDYKSIEFDAPTLARFNPQAATLVQTLNRFGLYNAGDLFNLGTLEFETKPEVKYIAPVYARGLTESWTLAVAIPVIQYTNNVQMKQSLSNVDYYNQFRGLSPDLDAALDTDLRAATQNVLIQKGYDPIENRNENFLGDIQLVSLWKIFESTNSKLMHQFTLSLPTGPKYNSDDLLALNTFHKTSIENLIGYSHMLGAYLSLSPYLNLKYLLPEKITARVPKNESDVLPEASSKDIVTKQEAFTTEVGSKVNVHLTDDFSLATDYRYGQKNTDQYSSSTKGDTSILAKNSKANWHKLSFEVSYSTVKSYLKKQSFIPMSLSFLVYDTFMGKNIERKTGQELSISLFF